MHQLTDQKNNKFDNSYSFLEKLKLAITDKSFGNIIIREKLSKSIAFYVKIALILTLFIAVISYFKVNTATQFIAGKLEEEVPNFYFKEGKLNVEGSMPMRIGSENFIVVIDTTDQTSMSELKPTTTNKLIVLINSKGFSSYNPSGATNPLGEFVPFSTMGSLSITKDELITELTQTKRLPMLFTFVLALSFFFHKILTPIYLFLFAKIIAIFKKLPLKNGPVLGISLYSLVIPNILHFFASGLSFVIPFFQWIYIGIGAFYVVRFYNNLNINIDKVIE